MGAPTYMTLGAMANPEADQADASPDDDKPWPYHQLVLAAHVKALVDAYGWRPEFAGDARKVPYMPVPFSERLLRFFWRATRDALQGDDVADEERKYLTSLRDVSTTAIGDVNTGVFQWNEEHFEKAPPEVAKRAPELYPAEQEGKPLAAGLPFPLVLKVNWSAHLLRNLNELAFGLDKLIGWTERLDLDDSLEDIVKKGIEGYKGIGRAGVRAADRTLEPFEAIGRKGVAVGGYIGELPGKLAKSLGKGIATVAVAGVVLGVVYVVTR